MEIKSQDPAITVKGEAPPAKSTDKNSNYFWGEGRYLFYVRLDYGLGELPAKRSNNFIWAWWF